MICCSYRDRACWNLFFVSVSTIGGKGSVSLEEIGKVSLGVIGSSVDVVVSGSLETVGTVS